MHIRKANTTDMPGIVRCARDFFAYAKFAEQGLPLCEDSFSKTAMLHITEGTVILLVDGDNNVRGGIAGLILPWPFNHSIKVMMEFFFWVDPDCRGVQSIKMLKKFEMCARTQGADIVCMVSVGTYLEERVSALYEKMGYRYFEQQYIKNLSGVKS